MNNDDLKDKIFVGVVEDNQDPKKIGRVKVRVMNVFEQIPTDDIPWAKPWRDLNGNNFIVPDIGKVVSIVFDQGNQYAPEYIYAEHYNANLEQKLSELSGSDYTSMRALMFDHKTQIYSNDTEGLKIDYKFNNVNIQENTIDVNLKDNFSNLNLGDFAASQQAVLGNNWMNWFDKLVDSLLGNGGGPFLGNLGSPVIPNPDLINILNEYKSLRDTTFLSKHVNIVDNNQVSKKTRVNIGQIGDSWKTTKGSNNSSTEDTTSYQPKPGILGVVDDPSYQPPPTDGKPDSTQPLVTGATGIGLTNSQAIPNVDKLIRFMQSKGYVVYTTIYQLNIVGMRNKPNGVITNRFDDKMAVFFKDQSGNWNYYEYLITTVPGYAPGTTTLPKNVAILNLGQYIDQYKLGQHQNRTDPSWLCLKYATSVVVRNDKDNTYDYGGPTDKGQFGINIHRSGIPQGNSVFNWSMGCTVFKNYNGFQQFIGFCKNQVSIGGKSTFTYTLIDQSQFDNFV